METKMRRGDRVSSHFCMRKEKTMKTWKLLLLCILCCGAFGGWWVIGCGSDSSKCEDSCNKINDCDALWMTGTDSVDDCKNKCLDNINQVECILDCDTDKSCGDYAACVQDSCNPTPPE